MPCERRFDWDEARERHAAVIRERDEAREALHRCRKILRAALGEGS